MLWLNDARPKIKEDNPGITVTEIAKKGGEMWKELKDKSVSLHLCKNCETYLYVSFDIQFHIIFCFSRNGRLKLLN